MERVMARNKVRAEDDLSLLEATSCISVAAEDSHTAPVSPSDSSDCISPPWSVTGGCGLEACRALEVVSLDDLSLYEDFDAVHYVDASPAGDLETGMVATGCVPGRGVIVVVSQLPGGGGDFAREVVCTRRSSNRVVRRMTEGASDRTVVARLGPPPAHVCHFRLLQAGTYHLYFSDGDGSGVTVVVGSTEGVSTCSSSSSGLSVDATPTATGRDDAFFRLEAGGWGVPVEGACWDGAPATVSHKPFDTVVKASWPPAPAPGASDHTTIKLKAKKKMSTDKRKTVKNQRRAASRIKAWKMGNYGNSSSDDNGWGKPMEEACWDRAPATVLDEPSGVAVSSSCSRSSASQTDSSISPIGKRSSNKDAAKTKEKRRNKNNKRAANRIRAWKASENV